MRHIKQIREWKETDDFKLDEDNIYDINDIFISIIDMGCEEFEIITDKFSSQSYNIKWVFPISLSIGSYPNRITSDSLRKHKERLMDFISLQDEIYYILDRLINMKYEIAYYVVEQAVRSNTNSILRFEIRVSRK